MNDPLEAPVKRYDCKLASSGFDSYSAEMEETDLGGDWVRWEDHEAVENELVFLRKLRIQHEERISSQRSSIESLTEMVESLREGIAKELETEGSRLNKRESDLIVRSKTIEGRLNKNIAVLKSVLDWMKTLPNNGHSWLREKVEDAISPTPK